ncbi:MAG: YjjG family noncanonical pyrimidine nucleotidase [Clostridia bacterium]|nr:YjjG family noncanonical pyrimidine nucleotidase [Clostridia bacterium]
MIQAIWIDIDDTLLDFDAYVKQAMQSGFTHFGLKPYEPQMFEVFDTINNGLWQQIEQGKLDFEGLQKVRFNTIFKALGIEFDGVRFERYFRECLWDSAILIQGVEPMLRYLSQKYLLYTASNGPYKQQLHRLEAGGIRHYFEDCFISEKIGVSKPDKAFYDRALQQLNQGREEAIAAAQCLMLGDSLRSDIAGGKAAGMQTLWFNKKGVANTTATVPDFEVRHLEEVKMYL